MAYSFKNLYSVLTVDFATVVFKFLYLCKLVSQWLELKRLANPKFRTFKPQVKRLTDVCQIISDILQIPILLLIIEIKLAKYPAVNISIAS